VFTAAKGTSGGKRKYKTCSKSMHSNKTAAPSSSKRDDELENCFRKSGSSEQPSSGFGFIC